MPRLVGVNTTGHFNHLCPTVHCGAEGMDRKEGDLGGGEVAGDKIFPVFGEDNALNCFITV